MQLAFSGHNDVVKRYVRLPVPEDSFQHHPLLQHKVTFQYLRNRLFNMPHFYFCKITEGSHVDTQDRNILSPEQSCHFDQAAVSPDHDHTVEFFRHKFTDDLLMFIFLT